MDEVKIREDLATYENGHGPTFACCSAHAVADAVPGLLTELDRLRAKVAELEGDSATP